MNIVVPFVRSLEITRELRHPEIGEFVQGEGDIRLACPTHVERVWVINTMAFLSVMINESETDTAQSTL